MLDENISLKEHIKTENKLFKKLVYYANPNNYLIMSH